MKNLSRPLLFFVSLFFALTILFRILLSHFLREEAYSAVMILAIIYGVSLFLSGWILGKAHGIQKLKSDFGLSFNAGSFLMWTAASFLWFLAGNPAETESIRSVYLAVFIWGGFVIIHLLIFLLLKRNSIKGFHRSEIFD